MGDSGSDRERWLCHVAWWEVSPMSRVRFPAEERALVPFPYETLLAYRRGEIADEVERARIEERLGTDPRWQAHWQSVRRLELDTAAAVRDADELNRFANSTQF